MAINSIEDLKKYFHDEDIYWKITQKTHPLYSCVEECAGLVFVKRVEERNVEMIFRCEKDKTLHILRECKDFCPQYITCQHVEIIAHAERLAKDYVNKTS